MGGNYEYRPRFNVSVPRPPRDLSPLVDGPGDLARFRPASGASTVSGEAEMTVAASPAFSHASVKTFIRARKSVVHMDPNIGCLVSFAEVNRGEVMPKKSLVQLLHRLIEETYRMRIGQAAEDHHASYKQ